jgi:hypothetical protein
LADEYGPVVLGEAADSSRIEGQSRLTGDLHDLLVSHGYWLTEDAWKKRIPRRTYIHDENATRAYIQKLAKVLASDGWEIHPNVLRAFRHKVRKEMLELEPGGAHTSGHFLHHMKIR